MYKYTEDDNINHELRAKYEKMSLEDVAKLMLEMEAEVRKKLSK